MDWTKWKKRLEDNPTLAVLGLVVCSFVAGFSAHIALLSSTDQEIVRAGSWLPRSEVEKDFVPRISAEELSARLAALESNGTVIELSQFTINANESFYEPRRESGGTLDDRQDYNWDGTIWSPDERHQELLCTSNTIGFDEESKHANTFGGSSSPHETCGKRARNYSKVLLTGDEAQRRILLSHLDPIFDITLVNRGDQSSLLTHIEVAVWEYHPPMGSTGGGATLTAPVEVAYRYELDLDKITDYQVASGHPQKVPLTPPINIPAGAPARIQLRFKAVEEEYDIRASGDYYELRIQFFFSNADPVATKIFGLSF